MLGIIGGREAELRPCECEDCLQGTAMQFISRRSREPLKGFADGLESSFRSLSKLFISR